jgi:putative hydrolase of the HAD superfamily
MRPRAVTFDATGTLFHCPELARLYAETMRRHGLEIAEATVGDLIPVVWRELDCRVERGEDRFGRHPHGPRGFWRDFLTRLCALAGLPVPSRFLAAELYERFGRAEAWSLYPEVPGVLAALTARGLRLGVISNWDERLPGVLAGLGVDESFATIVYSQRVGVEKPHPAIFRRTLEELGAAPAEAVHVGDRRRHDVEGADAVGMRGVLLDRTGESSDAGALESLDGLDDVLA